MTPQIYDRQIYDRDGQLMSTDEWVKAFGDRRTKFVNTTRVVDPNDLEGTLVVISTVWMGLNHNFGEGPPLIFETMIFGGSHDGYQERYEDEHSAKAGHDRAVIVASHKK